MSELWEVVYQALASSHRRSALRYLRRDPTSATFDDVIEHLVDEGQVSSSPDEVARVRTKMYHVHLPKLCEAELAEWDGSSTVRPSSLLRQLPPELLSPQLKPHAETPQGADD